MVLMLSVLFLQACTPSDRKENEKDPGSPDETQSSQDARQKQSKETTPTDADHPATHGASLTEKSDSREPETSTPDWKQRYQDLVSHYSESFSPPNLGKRVTVRLAAGREITGILKELRDTELKIENANGRVSLPADSLSPSSAVMFFRHIHATSHARNQATREYHAWNQRHATPTQSPKISRQQTAPRPTAEAVRNQSKRPPPGAKEDRMFKVNRY